MKKENRNQVVEVVFPSSNKTYSYIGSGNLRVGQQINNAPVNHYISKKPYTAPVQVVATHSVEGAEVGDKIGVTNGKVHTIGVGLKYLPGAREQQIDNEINIGGETMKVSDYMSTFQSQPRQRLLNQNTQNNLTQARNRLLGR